MPLPLILGAGAVGGVVATIARYWVGYSIVRWIAALGVGIVTWGAADTGLDYVIDYVTSRMSSTAGYYWQFAEAVDFVGAANVVFSAYVASLAIRKAQGITSRLTFGKASV